MLTQARRVVLAAPRHGIPLRSLSSSAGLSFHLTDDQKAVQGLARQFSADVIIPAAAELDRTGAFPEDIFRQAWELGLVNAHVPEAFGGLGLHTVEGCVIGEELAYGCSGVGTAVEANTLAQMPVPPRLTRASAFTAVVRGSLPPQCPC